MNTATEEEISNKMIEQGWGFWSEHGNYGSAVYEAQMLREETGMKVKIMKIPQIEGFTYQIWCKIK